MYSRITALFYIILFCYGSGGLFVSADSVENNISDDQLPMPVVDYIDQGKPDEAPQTGNALYMALLSKRYVKTGISAVLVIGIFIGVKSFRKKKTQQPKQLKNKKKIVQKAASGDRKFTPVESNNPKDLKYDTAFERKHGLPVQDLREERKKHAYEIERLLHKLK